METCPSCGHTLTQEAIKGLCPACGNKIGQNPLQVDLDEHGHPRCKPYNAAGLSERTIVELLGMAKKAVSDGIVTLEEAKYILRWMKQNATVANCWPCKQLFPRLAAMLANRIQDRNEQKELWALLHDITGSNFEVIGAQNLSTTLPLDQPQPPVEFRGSTFCFIGKFCYGTHRCCQDAVTALGGIPFDTITKSLNYLIIGVIENTDWIHSTHGRKIEKAVEYRSFGNPLAIISEEHWVSNLQKH